MECTLLLLLLCATTPHAASWSISDSPPPLSTWQCKQGGSVYRNGALIDASLPCSWGRTEALQQEMVSTSSCPGAKMLAAIEKKDGERVTLRLEGLFQPPVSSRTVET